MGKLLLVVLVIALLLVLLLRNRKPGAGQGQSTSKPRVAVEKTGGGFDAGKTSPKPYQSVRIKTRLGACNPAIALQDQVFLASEAPPLPLTECDVEQCACRYIYLDDRRQEDRRTPFGQEHGAVAGGGDNQRDGEDRRQE